MNLPGRTARRKARKHALDVLFEADMRGVQAAEVAKTRAELAERPLPPYAQELLEGISRHSDAIDDLIRTYAEDWPLERMPAVDRAILRIGLFELVFNDDVPDPVAIDEAVDLAAELSTDDSPRFVNGILGRIQLTR